MPLPGREDNYVQAQAVSLAESVNEIEGFAQPASLDALAAAYAESGAFDRAVSTSLWARELAVNRSDDELAVSIEQRADLYREGIAYRE